MVIKLDQETYTAKEVEEKLYPLIEAEMKKTSELTEANAQKFLTDKGAKIFRTDSDFEEAALAHPKVKTNVGTAFKTATQKLVESTGIPANDGERYEEYVARAIPSIKKAPSDENTVSKTEYEALNTKFKAAIEEKDELSTKLDTFTTKERTATEEKLMIDALKGKKFALPEGFEYMEDDIRAKYFAKIREKYEFSHDGDNIYLKSKDGKTTVSEIVEHLNKEVDSFGIKFAESAPGKPNMFPAGGPGKGGATLQAGTDEYDKAFSKAQEAARERGVTGDRELWKIATSEYNLPLPGHLSEDWLKGDPLPEVE